MSKDDALPGTFPDDLSRRADGATAGEPPDKQVRRVRRFVTWTFLKLVTAAGVLFGLVRVAIPNLVNAHDDALGALALLSAIAAPVVLGWTGVSLFLSTRRFLRDIGKAQ